MARSQTSQPSSGAARLRQRIADIGRSLGVAPPLAAGSPVEERLSQTAYDDGGATWRIITAVAAWRTGSECADLPTDAQLDAISSPV